MIIFRIDFFFCDSTRHNFFFLIDFILIRLIFFFCFVKFSKLVFLLPNLIFQHLICLDLSFLVKLMSKISQVASFEN